MTPQEAATLAGRVRDFIEREVIPLESGFLNRPFHELLPVTREKRAKVKSLGLWAPHS